MRFVAAFIAFAALTAFGSIEIERKFGSINIANKSVEDASLLTFRISPEAAYGEDVYDGLKTFTTQDGTELDPVFFYEASEAGATDWDDSSSASAGNLSINGAGADPTLSQQTPIPGEVGVMFNDANVFAADSTLTGDIASDSTDYVLEVVAFIEDVGATQRALVSKYDGGSSHFFLYQTNAYVSFQLSTIGPIRCLNNAAENLTWYHFLIFMDRSGTAQCFANAVAETQVSISGAASASNSSSLVIGGLTTSLQKSDHTIVHAAMWKCPAGDATCLDAYNTDSDSNSITDWQDVAYTRMAKISGMWPVIGGDLVYVSTIARTSGAYIHTDGSGTGRDVMYVGAGWPRMEKFTVGASAYYGHRFEPTATNLMLYSEAIGSWSSANLTITDNNAVAPDGTTTAELLTMTDTQAAVYQSLNHNTTSTPYTASYFVKPGTATWVWINFNHSSISSPDPNCYYDISNVAVGTCTGSVETTGRIEEYANGWVRVELTYWNSASDTTTGVYLYPAEADEDLNFSASGATLYLWGGQDEVGEHASSYIFTSSAAATRQGDVVVFAKKTGSLVSATGTVYTEILVPSVDPSEMLGGTSRNYWYIDDTGSTDFMSYGTNDTTESGFVMYGSSAYQVQIENFNAATGAISTMRVKWQGGNDADVIFNGSSEGTDTSFTVPSGLTVLYYSGSPAANAHMGEFQIYDGSYTDEEN